MKQYIFKVFLVLLLLPLVGCSKVRSSAKDPFDSYVGEYKSIYVSDEEKAAWFAPIVKLISNQEELIEDEYGRGLGYEAPRPNEPSISYGWSIGLFDVTMDGVPEVIVNCGGGSSGCVFLEVYDIFSGQEIGNMDSNGKDGCWGIYYNLETGKYFPLGSYSWNSGWDTELRYITTISYNEELQGYNESCLFYARYFYEDSDYAVAHISCSVNGEDVIEPNYQYRMTRFYQENCLLPQTGIKMYSWSSVSDSDDSYQERAEKMARMLLYGSGQQFVRFDRDQ